MVIIVMGVSASGKTEVGTLLAEKIGGRFLDADDYHSPANKAKMANHIALTDDDRAPWLATLRDLIEEALGQETHLVLACSALKVAYRYQLRVDQRHVQLLYLRGDVDGIARHILERQHEYFKGLDMLITQLCTLEEPLSWENAIVLPRSSDFEGLAEEARAQLGL